MHGHVELVQLLLHRPMVHIEAVDNEGNSPLHTAAASFSKTERLPADSPCSHLKIIKDLFDAGVVASSMNDGRETPLHLLLASRKPEEGLTPTRLDAVRCLLDNYADLNAKDLRGGTPLDYLSEEEKQPVLDLVGSQELARASKRTRLS
jgi:ankyrin repeat protein